MVTTAASLAVVSAALLASLSIIAPAVEAHGILTDPKPTIPKGPAGSYGDGFCAVVYPSSLPQPNDPNGKTLNVPELQSADVWDAAFKKTGQNLKDFILKNQDTKVQVKTDTRKPVSDECGFSDPNGTPRTLPDKLKWQTNAMHHGPCVVYCDDEIAVPHTKDCWKTFENGVVPYDKAKCEGKRRLTIYWLGVWNPPWQVYINCVPLAGAKAGNNSSPAATPMPKPLPAPAPTAVPSTHAPVTHTPVSVKPTPIQPSPTALTPTKAPTSPSSGTPSTKAPGSTPSSSGSSKPATGGSNAPSTPSTPGVPGVKCNVKGARK